MPLGTAARDKLGSSQSTRVLTATDVDASLAPASYCVKVYEETIELAEQANAVTLTLPPAGLSGGRVYTVSDSLDTGTGTIIVQSNEGVALGTLSVTNDFIVLYSNGRRYLRLASTLAGVYA